MYKIMIVEDDETICTVMSRHFAAWGMQVHSPSDFSNITSELNEFSPHIVLMDVSLPFFNGFHWCSEIRKISKVPIIFISSVNDNMSMIMAMNMGGDDYVTKPFDLNVLNAKVQALLRRTYDFAENADYLEACGVMLNLADATAVFNGKKIDLTKNEYRILQILFENKGKAVSRDFLMEHLWKTDIFIDENTLNVNINRLRRKLAEYGVENLIITKKGIGYMVGERGAANA